MNDHIQESIADEFDPENALRICSRLVKTDSLFTFPAFHRTSRSAVAEMRRAGLEEVEIHSFAADGATRYGDWTVPKAWDVSAARLWLSDGAGYSVIADRSESKCAVMMYSAPTPGNRPVECRIVSETKPRLWPGNLVFVENPDSYGAERLARGGALGIVTDHMPTWPNCRNRNDVYDVTLWNNSWLAPANEHGLTGMQLTPRMGDRVRAALRRFRGSAPARITIKSRLYDGKMDFVTGILPGKRGCAEEAALFAHLFEPGANDNASGCAMGIEALRTLNALVRGKALRPLHRSIRLCFPMEIVGTLAYFDRYPERMQPIVAAVNPDMVGADMDLVRSRLNVYGTPDSAPSYADALLAHCIERSFASNHLLRRSEKPFFINDNIVTDPAIGIPCPALICLRDRFYHSDRDTAANLSPTTMRAIGSAMAVYLYEISRGESRAARRLADRILSRGIAELNEIAEEPDSPHGELIDYVVSTVSLRLRSLTSFLVRKTESAALKVYVRKAETSLRDYAESRKRMIGVGGRTNARRVMKRPPRDLAEKAKTLFPVKTVIGTFRLADFLRYTRGRASSAEWSYELNAPAFWADGARSIYEIWRMWSFEFRKPRTLETVIRYFELLERSGHVSMRRSRRRHTA